MKSWSIFLKIGFDFPGGPVVKTANPLQRAWVRSLVWELRSSMLHSTAKTKLNKASQ